MQHLTTTAMCAVIALAMASATPVLAAEEAQNRGGSERIIVIDAPDLRKVPEKVIGPRFSTLIGEPIYSNSGKQLGEIEDFVMAKGGAMYAVIDTENGPIEELVEFVDDDIVIVPLGELRRSTAKDLSAMPRSSAR